MAVNEKNKLLSLMQGYGAENVLRLLETLRQTESGGLLYKHVSHVVGELERNEHKIARGYAAILHNFINAIRRQLPSSSLLYQELKLIQLRLQPPITVSELESINQYLKNALQLLGEVSRGGDSFWHEVMQPLTEMSFEPAPDETASTPTQPSEDETDSVNISSANINISDLSLANLPQPEIFKEKETVVEQKASQPPVEKHNG